MKNSTLPSLALVVATTFVALGSFAVQYSAVFYSVVPCIFLLLLAAGEYAPKTRLLHKTSGSELSPMSARNQRLRLAA
ncbi:MAG: hypothetical protein ABIV50_05815 [Opitutus sp.]